MKEHVVSVCNRGTSCVPAHSFNAHEDGTWSITLPCPAGIDAENSRHYLKFVVRLGFWQLLQMLFGSNALVFKLASNMKESVFFFEGRS